MRVAYSEEEFDAKLSDRTEGKPEWHLAMIPCILNILWRIRRHIEFQILADTYGNVVHLGERDCSIQRNHQKMIEEAPSAASVIESYEQKMGEAAVKAAKAAGYVNAGTIEFLLENNDALLFYGDEYPNSGGASGD